MSGVYRFFMCYVGRHARQNMPTFVEKNFLEVYSAGRPIPPLVARTYECSRHADAARHFFIPGWEVPQTWPGTHGGGGGGYGGVPDDGHFTVEYCSDEVGLCMCVKFI